MIHQLKSLDHPLLVPYRDLNRSNRTRQDDWFIGEGRLVVGRMLDSDYDIVSVVLGDQVSQSFRDRIPDAADTILLERQRISQLVGFEFHSGVLGCARRRRIKSLDGARSRIDKSPATVVVCPFTVLPDNLGAIIRICTGFGIDALIVGEKSADPFSRRAMRVSMGNALPLTIIEPHSTVDTLEQLKHEFGYCLVAATGTADAKTLPLPRPAERIAIVLGNEADGIEPEMVKLCDIQVSIPMSGDTDSLNVANAAAVLMYQFTRV